jgi:hypothetical protein
MRARTPEGRVNQDEKQIVSREPSWREEKNRTEARGQAARAPVGNPRCASRKPGLRRLAASGKTSTWHARSGRCARADPVGGGPKMEGKNEIEDGRHALRANEAERRKSLSAEPKTNLASSPSRGTKTQLRKQRNLLATRSTRKVESQQSNENKN